MLLTCTTKKLETYFGPSHVEFELWTFRTLDFFIILMICHIGLTLVDFKPWAEMSNIS